ncbi:hypothetical protein [Streptomyces sp. SP17KL33]|nr:hypothetical protein [Streptomyces sp. SP17KL33]
MRRTLQRIDDDALDMAVGTWLAQREGIAVSKARTTPALRLT